MPSHDPLGDALRLAQAQLARLAADDFDAYVAALPEYEAACNAVASMGSAQSPHDARLTELIEIQRRIAAQIDASKAQLTQRMAKLRVSRRANGAYLAQLAIPQQPIGQA
jgi:hypothetical protein